MPRADAEAFGVLTIVTNTIRAFTYEDKDSVADYRRRRPALGSVPVPIRLLRIFADVPSRWAVLNIHRLPHRGSHDVDKGRALSIARCWILAVTRRHTPSATCADPRRHDADAYFGHAVGFRLGYWQPVATLPPDSGLPLDCVSVYPFDLPI